MQLLARRLAVKAISLYQEYLRGALPSSCRFVPSCSEYSKKAIIKYGIFRGASKGIKRLFCCNPFSHRCGDDPLV